MGTCHFQAPTQQKPFDRSFWNFAQLIRSAWPLNTQKMVTIGWVGAARHIGEIEAYIPYLNLPYFTFFFFATKPTDQTTQPICTQDISNDADCSKEVPFGGLIDGKALSRGHILSPKNFKGHFTCKSKKSHNFWQEKDNRKIPKQAYTKLESTNRAVTSLAVQHAP
jgi:hypothetical protein